MYQSSLITFRWLFLAIVAVSTICAFGIFETSLPVWFPTAVNGSWKLAGNAMYNNKWKEEKKEKGVGGHLYWATRMAANYWPTYFLFGCTKIDRAKAKKAVWGTLNVIYQKLFNKQG